MKERILARGAEAIIKRKKDTIVKERVPKGYRNKELDLKIRKSRTKKEAKILEKASKMINVPKIKKQEPFSLEMEFLDGNRLSEILNSLSQKQQEKILKDLGKQVARLHQNDIIHGDLTTSNVILKKDKVYLIDFGLSFISKRIEDKAVDLHLIKQALEAKHWQIHERLFQFFLKGYDEYKEKNKIIEQLKKVESRGRYRH